jgi:Uma2 family endonuclease
MSDARPLYSGDVRYENLGDGPVAMAGGSAGSPNHGVVIANVIALFKFYLKKNVCSVLPSDVKVVFPDGQYVYPDVSVLCDRSRRDKKQINGAPDLVVEVLSPSTESVDRGRKLQVYFENGAKEVWLINLAYRSVDVYRGLSEVTVYRILPEWELESMEEDDKAKYVFDHAESKLFPDFKPMLLDIFDDVD